MRTHLLFIALVLGPALAGCDPASDGNRASTTSAAKAPTKAECDARGGKLVRAKVGMVCALPAKDAGKRCTDSSACEGLCLASGQCSPYESNFGCNDVLDGGKKVTICID